MNYLFDTNHASFVGWVKQSAPNKTIVQMGSLRLTHPTRLCGLCQQKEREKPATVKIVSRGRYSFGL